METTVSAPLRRVNPPQGLVAAAALVLTAAALVAGYRSTSMPVTLVVDGRERHLATHEDTVAMLLMDSGLVLGEKDIVKHNDQVIAREALDAVSLGSESRVTVERARPVYVSADGHTVLLHTAATSVEALLREARVSIGPHDALKVDGHITDTNLESGVSLPEADSAAAAPPRIEVQRAVPFTIHEDGEAKTFYTTASTIGEALRRAGLVLYLADGVQPGLGQRLSPGMAVKVERSVPVQVQVDGRTLRTRTHRQRVDEVLADLGVVLTGQDYTTPALESALEDGLTIRVVRVTERFLVEQEPIPFESVWQADPDLEIDLEHLMQDGAPGALQRRVRVTYEDGYEVGRAIENEYVAIPPTTKIWGYGTQVVVRTLDTASGPVEYWRVIRMVASSYSASTAGTSPSSSWYGRTATGMRMGFGVVAVDPRVINLRSKVYVPGYGVGIAGDTGSAVKGRRIDLGYDDDNLVLWYRWVDVYLLTPVPSVIDYRLGL